MLRILLCMLSVLPAVPGAIQLPDGQLQPEFSSFNTGKHTFKLINLKDISNKATYSSTNTY